MKKIFILALISTLVACEEKDLSNDNPAPEDKNTLLATSFIYGDEGIHSDTALTNNLGYSFFITKVQIVVNKFIFVENSDTIIRRVEPFIITMKETDQKLVQMEPGGYSGFYGLQFGLDSIESIGASPLTLPEDNELRTSDVFRKNFDGIDHFVVKGRLMDPNKPQDTIGTIPFEYRLGTFRTNRVEASLVQNFAVARNSTAKFVLQIDLEPMLEDFDIFKNQSIISDPTVPVDINTAIALSQGLKIGLF
jgi:hypothetical protein